MSKASKSKPSKSQTTQLELSVVVPVYNEAENVKQLVEEIAEALQGTSYEMVFVNDKSTDDTMDVLASLKDAHPQFEVRFQFTSNPLDDLAHLSNGLNHFRQFHG